MASSRSMKYQSLQTRFERLVNAMKPVLGRAARKAFEKNLIASENLGAAENPMLDEDYRTSRFLRQLLDKIGEDDDHFDTFVAILQDIPVLKEFACELTKAVFGFCSNTTEQPKEGISCHNQNSKQSSIEVASDSRSSENPKTMQLQSRRSRSSDSGSESAALSFQCRCGSNCSLDTCLSGKCRGHLEKVFPYLDMRKLSESDREKLIRGLVRETNKIITMFEELVYDTFESLIDQETPIDELRRVALTFGHQSLPRPYQEDQKEELSKIKTTNDVHTFLLEHNYISFFNYRILKRIIKRLGTFDDRKRLEDYVKNYREFCRRSVFEVPLSTISNSSPQQEKSLVVKVNERIWFGANHKSPGGNFTMEDVYAVGDMIALEIGVDPENVLLKDVGKGCIKLCFAVLSDVDVSDVILRLDKYGIFPIDRWQHSDENKTPSIGNTKDENATKFQLIPTTTDCLPSTPLSPTPDSGVISQTSSYLSKMKVDARGTLRSSCDFCGYVSYDGGSEPEMWCSNCGHTPLKRLSAHSAPIDCWQHSDENETPSSGNTKVKDENATKFQLTQRIPSATDYLPPIPFPPTPDSGVISQTSSYFFKVKADTRGTLRGSCHVCGCDSYDGGSEAMRCLNCGHPPGRHKNLSVASTPTFSISPKCQYPGCTNYTYYDMNTDQEYIYCQSHVGLSSLYSSLLSTGSFIQKSFYPLDSTPVLPPEQQCKLQGCTRPRQQDPNGTTYDFCGKVHALHYSQQEYTKQSGLTTALAVAGIGTCSFPGCRCPKYVDPANQEIHDYCGRAHAYQAQQLGITVSPTLTLRIQLASIKEFTAVQIKFQQKWATRKGTCPNVDFVFVVMNQNLQQRFQTYRQTLTNQTVEEHYHGTKLTCDITNTGQLCTDLNCGVCGISQNGFDRRCICKNINFQRFGHGFYLNPNSSKSHDYTQGAKGYRAMLVCDVCPGNKYNLTRDDQSLRGPPQGFDSIYGQAGPGCSLNYPEIVLHNPDAILPKYIVVYQKDGIGKIAS